MAHEFHQPGIEADGAHGQHDGKLAQAAQSMGKLCRQYPCGIHDRSHHEPEDEPGENLPQLEALSLAPITGATAAMAEPPQIAVPAPMRVVVLRSSFSSFPAERATAKAVSRIILSFPPFLHK